MKVFFKFLIVLAIVSLIASSFLNSVCPVFSVALERGGQATALAVVIMYFLGLNIDN